MHKRLVFSIVQYLNGLIHNSETVPAGLDKEGLEVAVQCISSAFGLDPANVEQYGVPFPLPDIYNFGLIHLAQAQQVIYLFHTFLFCVLSIALPSSLTNCSKSSLPLDTGHFCCSSCLQAHHRWYADRSPKGRRSIRSSTNHTTFRPRGAHRARGQVPNLPPGS